MYVFKAATSSTVAMDRAGSSNSLMVKGCSTIDTGCDVGVSASTNKLPVLVGFSELIDTVV